MENKKFMLGRIVATRTIAERMNRELHFGQFISDSFKRYMNGDWGEMCQEDQKINNQAVEMGEGRIHGSYIYKPTNEKIWIVTERDRSVTTVLYPSEH